MPRSSANLLLAVFGAGVFLAGLELMITAVALPAIILDLAPDPILGFRELRKASWIINGYLLVYVVAMPLSGRLADLWGARRLFLGALAVFTVGSALAGRAQSMDELIAARLIQAAGGGVLVPVATAAASHLFDGHLRPRALGVVGALTFLGMAAGPFAGAAILGSVHAETALAGFGVGEGPLLDALSPAWRWVFYANVPIGFAALALGWVASYGWDTPRREGRVDVLGAVVFSVALGAGLIGVTLVGDQQEVGGIDPAIVSPILVLVAVIGVVITIALGLRRSDPFLDPRLFRRSAFSSSAIVSLLTGYAFATAIIGGAVFVDRVLYGGPDDQRLALGALAGATALGALVSGFALRLVGLRVVTLIGLAASTLALVRMTGLTPATPIGDTALMLGVFGAGFGLTVTPRSTAAVEAVGRRAFGVASATVTVARMIGMAIGLAVLTAYGSTTIDRLYDQVYATDTSYQQFIPEELRNRPLRDGLVVEALEAWAAGEASRIMVGIFLAAAGVSALAMPAALAMGGRPRMLAAHARASEGPEADAVDDRGPSLAL
ncbi:MAG TPA: MFS transporter [Candidatus Limnocylindrales bacterium]|jgi:MFS family permease